MHEILLIIEDSHQKEKMFYDLQYGLLDMPDNHLSDDDIGPFLRDLTEVKQYITVEYREYSARTQHYERLHQVVKKL
jgi:DNA polymerase sigma